MRRRRRAGDLVVAFAAMVLWAGCAGQDTGTTASTTSVPAPTVPSVLAVATDPAEGGVTPEGFDLIAATVVTAEGEECEVCLWLAATPDQRRLGLMGVTDLGAADGMAFVYPEPHSGSFWMKNTLLPLSIAFFDPEGSFLEAFDMEPCTADPCVQYPTPRGFVVAVEVTAGGLGPLGIGPGSVLRTSELPCG